MVPRLVPFAPAVLSLAACASNHAPEILSVNGTDTARPHGGNPFDEDDEEPAAVYLYGVRGAFPGGHAVLRFEIDDRDGDEVQVVFYGTPGRLTWDERRRTATVDFFDVVTDGSTTGWYVSVLDDGNPPLASEYLIDFDRVDPSGDSGDTGGIHSGR